MKKLLLISTILLYSILSNAQSPNWLWAKSAGGTNPDQGNSITTDAVGNIYVTGEFNSSSITFGTTTLQSAGLSDMFIVKYDAFGNVLWAKSNGGISNDWGTNITTDITGNIYVIGSYLSPSIVFGTNTLTNVGDFDIFIIKYDPFGNELWAKSFGSLSQDYAQSITCDAIGNIYVAGGFASSSITFGSTTLTNKGQTDIYVVKYDTNGNVIWAKSADGTWGDFVYSITNDATGNVYITGKFFSPSITFGNNTLTNAGFSDMFIAKYDAIGNVLWAKSANAPLNSTGNGISTDVAGNVYVTGGFEGSSITFGTITLTNISTSSDVFIAKYAPNGNEIWAKSFGASSQDYGYSITNDTQGYIYIIGMYNGVINLGTTTLSNAGNIDIFIVKYDALGNMLWANSVGGLYNDYGIDITIDTWGNVCTTGNFNSGVIGFSSITFGTTILTSGGGGDAFIAQLVSTTEINKNIEQERLIFFPNPSTGQFTFNNLQKESVIEIYDITGRLILNTVTQNTSETIDLSDKQKGVYFYKIISDKNDIKQGKIILQ